MDVKKVKASIRERIWRILEERNIATFPRPVYGRIPNFIGSDIACEKILDLPEFKCSEVVKINPDSPQRRCRELVLEMGKILIMPTPRIRHGFLLLDPKKIPKNYYRDASTISGAFRWGVNVKPWNLPKIDLVIIGSVAVNLKGARLGKGEGYAELEWGILSEVGKVSENTPIITTVHDLQIVNDDIPVEQHDVPVDIIVTPSKVIRVNRVYKKPSGIIWSILKPEKLKEIPVLEELRKLSISKNRV